MIRNDNLALLSEESANEIAFWFNAYNSMVAINGASVIQADGNIFLKLGDFDQSANPTVRVELIKAGSSDTFLSAARLNALIHAYNRIMSSRGDGIVEPRISDGSACIVVADVDLSAVAGNSFKWGNYIQPVFEGGGVTAFSESIWRPMVDLARALSNMRGINCDLYLSDGRFVLDLVNSTRGPGGRNPDDGGPDDKPPPYRPPPGGWDGNGGDEPPPGVPPVSGWFASKYARHKKTGFIPFSDYAYESDGYVVPSAGTDISYSQYISGAYYLSLTITRGASSLELEQENLAPASSNYRLNLINANFAGELVAVDPPPAHAPSGPNAYAIGADQGTVGVVGIATINRRGVAYWLQNPFRPTETTAIDGSSINAYTATWLGATPNSGSAQITLNQYTAVGQRNNLYFYNGGSFDFIDRNNWIEHFKGELVVDKGYSGLQFTHKGAKVVLGQHFTTKMLYQNVYDMLTGIPYVVNTSVNITFVQPTGGSSSSSVPSTSDYDVINPPPGTTYVSYFDTIPEDESVFSNENQNVLTTGVASEPTWDSYGTSINYGAMHFRRKANGTNGSYEEPVGFIIDLERKKTMVGNYSSIWVAKYSVPTEHIAPRFPSARMPSSAQLESLEEVFIGVGSNTTLYTGDSPEYSVWATSNLPALSSPMTPVVYTSGANAPTLTNNGGGSITYKFFHGEPYLTWRIYRNTVNNTGSATLIAEVSEITEREISTGIFRMAYTDEGLSAGTYYYWHKGFWNSSRVSGFSAVTSITI